MCRWLLNVAFAMLLIRITLKRRYAKSNNKAHAQFLRQRCVFNRNVSWKVHLINSVGYILKTALNYELFNVSSFDWFKKRAMEGICRELNGFRLNDFGDENEMSLFEQRYFDLSAIWKTDPSACSFNTLLYRTFLLQAMKERLRIVQQLKTHPEIRRIKIKAPICIMGLPRTGTTLLYNLLALDSASCYPTFDLAVNPSLPWDFGSDKPDPRVVVTERTVRKLKGMMVNFTTAHYFDTHAPEECTISFINMALDFLTIFGGGDLACLKYLLDDVNFRQVYEYHRLLAQFLCYKKRGWNFEHSHCLFKSPFHVLHLPSLLAVYNDARVIVTHRQLNEVVPSLASLMEMSCNTSFIDRFDLGRRSLQICGILTDIILKETTTVNTDETFMHVSYTELMKNPKQEVKKIYSQFRLDYTEEFDKRITQYLHENPQGRHGRHTYSLGKYGLSDLELQYKFDSYSKRFLTAEM